MKPQVTHHTRMSEKGFTLLFSPSNPLTSEKGNKRRKKGESLMRCVSVVEESFNDDDDDDDDGES